MTFRTRRIAPPSLVLALGVLLASSFPPCPTSAAADAPARLATTGRFDLKGDVPLDDGRVVAGDGSIGRMNWVPADRVGEGYTINFAINRLGWRRLAVSFRPSRSGTVTLTLMGPWEQSSAGGVLRQEVLWDDLRVEGAELAADPGFESKRGWEGAGVVEPPPAASGSRVGRTWHDETLSTRLAVKAGVPVVIHVQALARTPEGYKDMKPIVGRDTPAHRLAKQFLRGANLGNGLEVPPGQDWAVKYTGDDVKRIKAEGFDHIRIPVGWHHYVGPAPDYKLSPDIFKKVDDFLDAAAREGLGAMINIHHFDDFTADPEGRKAEFLAIWRQVAEHNAGRPANVAFELLNEPKDAATTEVVNRIFAETVKVIRESNPDRLIVAGPGRWNSISELPAFRLPDDDGILVTVHSYDPFFFTHQGASWTNRGDDGRQKGIRFPGPPASPLSADPALRLTPGFLAWIHEYNTAPAASNPSSPAVMDKAVEAIREWSEHYGRPVYLGEFGAIMAADPESRANYYREFRKRLEKAGVGWAIWDWHAGFNYWDVDEDRPLPGLREALFGRP
ncbi:glycoside hydrolase family 5 protein [Planctomyces sp. SH-PL62]|uniref:glycoside hydrolase family 5 protein n=1 Tax=Planctomyces sp. SH-PL62 TaxID=1636152 RepID=UPI00078B3309|nr:glycoside hydrolase family 5 protein [Planctomyces sp. SH-PL62]AMV36037.1 Endoglucanase H precursor [Planctomyces sp. SH-PL62]